MATKTKKVTKRRSVTKTEGTTNTTSLVVQDIRVVSADRSRKDIGDFRTALQSAESIHYPNRVRLFDLYEDITLDGHLTGIMEKRVEAVLNKNLYFVNSAGKRVDVMDDIIESEVFREIVTLIMQTPAYGLSGLEFIPGKEIKFKEIPRKHIKIERKVIAYEQNDVDGKPYDGVQNIWVIGKEKDLGYLLKCSPYALWKRGAMADWSQYVEIFGQPVRIVYYDAYDTKTKMEVKQVLDESGSSLALMIPKQAQFEMKDGKQSNGTGELQEKFKQSCDDEMSVIVLGNTETTTSSKRSGYAQSKTHDQQQLEKTKNDLKYVKGKLNSKQFLDILRSYGLPVEGGKFKFEKELDIQKLAERIAIDIQIETKVPIPDDYWYDTYGITKPDNYEELKAKREAEKAAAQQQFNNNPDAPNKPPKKQKATTKEDLKSDGLFTRLKAFMIDFFQHAP
jgi:hypothetical protein